MALLLWFWYHQLIKHLSSQLSSFLYYLISFCALQLLIHQLKYCILLRCRTAKEQRDMQDVLAVRPGTVWKEGLAFYSRSCLLPLLGDRQTCTLVSSTYKSCDPESLLNLRLCILMGKTRLNACLCNVSIGDKRDYASQVPGI